MIEAEKERATEDRGVQLGADPPRDNGAAVIYGKGAGGNQTMATHEWVARADEQDERRQLLLKGVSSPVQLDSVEQN